MLAFNFASRTFAYRRPAQGLSRFVSASSSSLREYLEPAVKGDQDAHYVEDIGIAANTLTDLTRIVRAVFKYLCQAALKPTIEQCHFGVRQIEFLGRTISPEGFSPQAGKIHNFRQTQISQIEKNNIALRGIHKLLQNLHSQDG